MDGGEWREAFSEVVRGHENAGTLRDAAVVGNLTAWTAALTGVVVSTCAAVGWQAAGKGHLLEIMPEAKQEYLGLDVMAFRRGEGRWHFPVAVFELENQLRQERIAYSLWKVLCVRAGLRVVFCYRREQAEGPPLVRWLADEVVKALPVEERTGLAGQTLIVVGSRNDVDTFPYGFFRWWQLDKNTAVFRRLD